MTRWSSKSPQKDLNTRINKQERPWCFKILVKCVSALQGHRLTRGGHWGSWSKMAASLTLKPQTHSACCWAFHSRKWVINILGDWGKVVWHVPHIFCLHLLSFGALPCCRLASLTWGFGSSVVLVAIPSHHLHIRTPIAPLTLHIC